MFVHGCSSLSGGMSMNHYQTHKTKPFGSFSVSASSTHLPARVAFLRSRSSSGPCQKLKSFSHQGTPILHLSPASSPFLPENQSGSTLRMLNLPQRRQSVVTPPRASAYKNLFSFKYPPMTKRPRFWWRTLACIPYLMPLHETWMFGETAQNLHFLWDHFKFWTIPFLRGLGRLPRWFLIAYFFIGYLGIVRRKEWPHFLRFHMIMGMLLEIALQVTGYISRWMPASVYWGKIGMHAWNWIMFSHLFTVLGCAACALTGKYADVPFFCDAAYIQIPYE